MAACSHNCKLLPRLTATGVVNRPDLHCRNGKRGLFTGLRMGRNNTYQMTIKTHILYKETPQSVIIDNQPRLLHWDGDIREEESSVVCMFGTVNCDEDRRRTMYYLATASQLCGGGNPPSSSGSCDRRKLAAKSSFFSHAKYACRHSSSGKPRAFS